MNFWRYKWVQHGSCMDQVFTQKEYFQRAIDIMPGLELVSELDYVGIVRDYGAPQEIADIKAVIFNHIGVIPLQENQ